MAVASIDFDAPDLAAQLEMRSSAELNRLPFGVIHLELDGTVLFYSAVEGCQSGYGPLAPGQNFFAVSPCMASDDFRGRIARAMEKEGAVDLEFGWKGDFADPKRDLRIRVQSSKAGGVWIMVERDPSASTPAA
jgi:photoactive yellow protein